MLSSHRDILRAEHLPTLGGLVLVGLSAHLWSVSPHRLVSAALAGIGLAFTTWGFLVRGRRSTPPWLSRPLTAVGDLLGISRFNVGVLFYGLTLGFAARAAAGDNPMVHSPLAVPLWVIGIALTLLGCRGNEGAGARQSWTTWERVALGALFLASFGIRAWNAGQMPYVLSGDEGSAGLVGWEFVQGTRDNLLALGWFSFPALYFRMLAVFQAILGRSTEAIRWVSALGGALGVCALYWSARALFTRRVAWLSALWLAGFHHHLFFSRVAYNNVWDGTLLITLIGALWRGWIEERRQPFLLAGIALGLSQYFYTTSRLTPLILLLWTIPLARRSVARRDFYANILCMGLVALSVVFPIGLLYLQHPDSLFFTASRTSILVPGWTEAAAQALGTTPLGLVLEQIWVTALGFTIAELQGVYFEPGVPLLFGLSALLFWIGLTLAIVRSRDPRYQPLLLTLLATLVIGGLSIQAPNAQRMLLLPPVLALLITLPLETFGGVLERFTPRLRMFIPPALLAVTMAAVAENVLFFYQDYLPRERYGSLNGEVTQAMVELLREEGPDTNLYFVGGERMSVFSIPSLPYLIEDVQAFDLDPPYEIPPPTAHYSQRTLVILPELSKERESLTKFCDSGVTDARYNRHNVLLFYTCTLRDL